MTLSPLYHCPFHLQFSEQHCSMPLPYKFNSKELDAETGLYYYGARYYTPEIGIWLSVDPMSDKYPSLSPYAYCALNPVILVDPDGMSYSNFDENGNYINTTKDDWIHNTFVGRKGRILDKEGTAKTSFKFNDYKLDEKNLSSGMDLNFQKNVDGLISEGANEINNQIELNKETNTSFPTLKGVRDAVNGGADFRGEKSMANSPNKLFLIDGVAYNDCDAGNFLTGAAMKKSNTVGQLVFRLGAHYNNHKNGNSQNRHNPDFVHQTGLIRLDSRADQKAIRNGFCYQRKRN